MATFTKILSETDVEKRLAIPTDYFERHMIGHFEGSLDLEVRDGSGQVWILGCSVRSRGYAKPAISRGWCNFVRAKGLKVGDKIAFSLQPRQDEAQASCSAGLKFRVAVTKRVKLFGVNMDHVSIL